MTYRTPRPLGFTLAALLLILGGCGPSLPENTPTAAELPPIPDNYRDLIRDHLHYSVLGEFAEGYSADISIREPYPAAYRRHGRTEWRFGHAVKAYATTPVRYGGYVAGRPYRYFFHDGAMRPVTRGDALKKLP